MGEIMTFPKRWEDFLHDYEFEDARMIYTNGSRLIPSFRVKQMMEHYAPVVHGRWIIKHKHRGGFHRYTGIDDMGEQHTITVDERIEYDDRYCSECGKQSADNFLTYCPNCGAMMDGGSD